MTYLQKRVFSECVRLNLSVYSGRTYKRSSRGAEKERDGNVIADGEKRKEKRKTKIRGILREANCRPAFF